MRFKDRREAGLRLAEQLQKYRADRPLVLAIPPGGLPIGRTVADALEADFDVILIQRMRDENRSSTLVFVDEDGRLDAPAADPDLLGRLQPDSHRHVAHLRARRGAYTPDRAAHVRAGRVVVLVDDGVETGTLMCAAVRSVRAHRPTRVVVASPVGALEAVRRVRREGVEAIHVLAYPAYFSSLEEFYDDLPAVSDEEAAALLAPTPRTRGDAG